MLGSYRESTYSHVIVDLELSVYRNFSEEADVVDFTKLLMDNSIEFEVAIEHTNIGSSFGDKPFDQTFYVKIYKEDFNRVDKILLLLAHKALDNIESDHYLYAFSNEELVEILAKPNEWSEVDYLLAQRILSQRGISIDKQKLEDLRRSNVTELAEKNESLSNLVYIGYTLAMLGGILGALIGLYLLTAKRTSASGSDFIYSKKERRQGFYIFLAGMSEFVFIVIRMAL